MIINEALFMKNCFLAVLICSGNCHLLKEKFLIRLSIDFFEQF